MEIKRIMTYLNGTEDKGMITIPTKEHLVEYYVDADFVGLFEIKQDQDAIQNEMIVAICDYALTSTVKYIYL